MAEAIPISVARQELFRLFDRAVRKEGEKLVIARRGQKRRAVLVSAAYLERLEAAAKPKPQLGRARRRGTMEIVGDPNTVLADVRARQNALSEAKWRRILAEDAGDIETAR